MKKTTALKKLQPNTPQRKRWLLRCIVSELENDRGDLQEAVDWARRLAVAHELRLDALLWDFAEDYHESGEEEWIFWALLAYLMKRFPDDDDSVAAVTVVTASSQVLSGDPVPVLSEPQVGRAVMTATPKKQLAPIRHPKSRQWRRHASQSSSQS